MKKLFTVLLCCLATFQLYAQGVNTDSLLTVLRSEIDHAHVYDQQKERRIAGLRHALEQAGGERFQEQYNLHSRLFEEYRSYRFDSAFVYVKRMVALATRYGQQDSLLRSELLLGTVCWYSGFYKEAFDIINKIDTNALPADLKGNYYNLSAGLNTDIAEYDNDAYFTPRYKAKADDDASRAETVLPSNDFEKTINLAFLPDGERPRNMTPDFFFHFINEHGLTPHGVAMVSTRISYAYSGERRILFLTLAAINDIRSSTKETLAAFLLGQQLYKQGNLSDAYLIMQEAARTASFYGARKRAVQVESMLPLISDKLIDQQQHERDRLLIGCLVIVIVAVVLFFVLVIYRKQLLRIQANEREIKEKNGQLETVNDKLWESSRIKEELIGLFFNTCSSYIETLDRVKKTILHNIKLGKYNEVTRLLNSVHIDEEKGQLYNMLDTVFLTMFPNFITAFNSLLKEDDQVWPKSGETLNATLRIFALTRLGVTDNEVVARILDYSVSTVYTYKTRIKSKALVPANDFEQKIMEIEFIDSQEP